MTDTPPVVKPRSFDAAAIYLGFPGRDMAAHMDPAIAELLRVIMWQGPHLQARCSPFRNWIVEMGR